MSLAIALLGAVWGIALMALGSGIDFHIFGVRIRSNSPFKVFVVASGAAGIFLFAGGRAAVLDVLDRVRQSPRSTATAIQRWLPSSRTVAWSLAIATAATAYIYGTKAVGGADSYGYLSEAEMFSHGQLRIEQSFVKEIPWSDKLSTFSPLGWTPAWERDTSAIVPTYPPGLPIVLAAVRLVAGYQAMFFVLPLSVGLLVFSTYAIGERLTSPAAGLIGAWLVATSPAVLFMMMTTMTDVPVAAAWAAAFWLVFGRGVVRAAAAGLVSSIAVLIRPNLVPIAAILLLYYVIEWIVDRPNRRRSLTRAALFALGVVPGALAVAWLNQRFYGSPTTSGYGRLSGLFALAHVLPNLRRYLGWLAESQTSVALAGLAALFLPVRSLWTGPERRSTVLIGTLVVIVVWAVYCAWEVFDAWWYLRFLLTSWPFIMIGVGVLAAAVMRWHPRVTGPIITAGVIGLGCFQLHFAVRHSVFNMWEGERRFVVGAQMVRRLTDGNSVILSGAHSGTLRFYGGRMTMHYDRLDKHQLDRAVDWMASHGVHPYFLLEPWEVDEARQRFVDQRTVAILEETPTAMYLEPGKLYLWDLSPPPARRGPPEIVTGTSRSLLAARPAAPPQITIK